MIKRMFFAVALLLAGTSLYAQEMYLAISGEDVTVQSGDSRHQYDIWIKPVGQAGAGTLQIFDAGLGGAVDLISGEQANTTTNFQLFAFESLYDLQNNLLTKRNPTDSAAIRLSATAQERFKNRWVSLSTLKESVNGYILRVNTSEGDDVNSFNLRVIDDNGIPITGRQWKVLAFDLSIGVYRAQTSTIFQLKPYWLDGESKDVNLVVRGEEDSRVRKIDSFGDEYPLSDATIPDSRFSKLNTWGIEITGSEQWLNTFTVYGAKDQVIWDYSPVVISSSQEPGLTLDISESNSCVEKELQLKSSSLGNFELSKAEWLINEEVKAKGASANISFDQRGEVPLRILIPNDRYYYPEYWNYTESVFVNTPPVAVIDAPKSILSPSEEVRLSAEQSYDPEGNPLSVSWFVNGARRSEGEAFTFSNTVSGSYKIGIRVSDGGNSLNCSFAEDEKIIRVNTQPYAEISVASVSGTNDDVELSVRALSDSDNDNLTFKWEGIGIPANTTGRTVTVKQELPGVYPVRLTVNDGTGATNSTYSVNKVYEINAEPIPVFTLPEKVAPGDLFTLNATESADPNQDPLSYKWLLGNEEIAQTDIATYQLDDPGSYEITLVVDDQRGVSNSVQRLTRTLLVNAPPKPVITAVPVTSTANVEFEATQSNDPESELASYTWDFGDGNRASGPRVSHTYQSTGSYTVVLTVDDGDQLRNSVQSSEHILVVNSYPQASFEVDEVVAPDQSFTADASASSDMDGSVTQYEWTINGTAAGSGVNNSFTLSEPGLHTIGLKVFDDSGFEEAFGYNSNIVRVNASPVAIWKVSEDDPVPGNEIRFQATESYDPDGTIDEFRWVFEDGTELTGSEIQRIFQEGGSKKFTLYVTDNDGLSNSTSSTEGYVLVNHQPYIVTESLVRSNDLNVRLDASESYDLDNDPLQFTWTLPDGTTRNEASFTWKAPKTGVHIIGLSVKDGKDLSNSISTESVQVNINQPAKAVVDSLILSCTGQTVLFNSSRSYDPDGDPFKVQWEFGDGSGSEQANPSHVYDEAGQYEATLTLSDGFSGKPSVAKIPVVIEGSPVARLNISDTTVCVNASIDLDASASSDPSGSMPAINWDLGDGTTATGATYRHVFTQPGTYTITLTAEGSGSGQCSNISQATTTVTVVEGPEASFELPDWTSPGQPILLDGSQSSAQGGFKKATWLIENNEQTTEIEGITASHTFAEAGTYVVTLLLQTNTDTDCNTVSLSKSITVNKQPEIVWELPENISAGTDLELNAISSFDEDGYIKQFKWYIDDGFVSYNAKEIVKSIEPGRHKVTLEITDNSDASNRMVRQEKYFFANSSPKPIIAGPGTVYLNQDVKLRSGPGQDQDGDLLSTTWKLNGNIIASPTFTANEFKTYIVTLIQDDGRGLPNSVDSAVYKIIPVNIPEITPSYPKRLVVGSGFMITDLGIGKEWNFVNGNFFESTWRATQPGKTSFTLAWTPEGEKLATKAFPVSVEERLAFKETPVPQVISWNPVNPRMVLTAPAVNRSVSDVSIIWKKNDEIIGRGSSINAELIRGQNRFTVEISDLNVFGSQPISVDLIVTTQ